MTDEIATLARILLSIEKRLAAIQADIHQLKAASLASAKAGSEYAVQEPNVVAFGYRGP